MEVNGFVIRELRNDDNYEAIHQLLQQTYQRHTKDARFIAASADEIKEEYSPNNRSVTSKGFVAERDEQLVAFVGVGLSEANNGYLLYGLKDNDVAVMKYLIDQCAEWIKENGGQKLYYFAATPFGQIRNAEITMFENLGFASDEYAHCSTHLALDYWSAPQQISNKRIETASHLDRTLFQQILKDDGELELSERFVYLFPQDRPDVVILTLKEKESESIAGFAYYKVSKVDQNDDRASAVAFGVHFRPQSNLHKNEKRRLLQAALISMKQLDLSSVNSTLTLKHFDNFVIMATEGFDDFLANSVRLVKVLE